MRGIPNPKRSGARKAGAAAVWLAAAALALASLACVSMDVPAEPEAPSPTATATPTATPATATPTAAPATPTPAPYDGEPVIMRIPRLGVEAPIEAIGIIEGRNQLDVPAPRNVGWYDVYDKPGFGTSSLYSAHKDYHPDIRGPFYALTELEAGDRIVVVMDDGREYVYEVFFQRRYATGDMPMRDLISPERAEDPELRRPASEEWITMYTCGGEFVSYDGNAGGPGYYVHRDVVIARLVERVLPESVAGG